MAAGDDTPPGTPGDGGPPPGDGEGATSWVASSAVPPAGGPIGPQPAAPSSARVTIHVGWLVGGAAGLVVVGVLAAAIAMVMGSLLSFGFMGDPGFVDDGMFDDGLLGDGSVGLSGLDPAVGDCLTAADDGGYGVVPCEDPHDLEVYASAPPPETTGPYPGAMSLDSYAWGWCDLAFGAYVGTEYMESELELVVDVPDRDAWEAGEQTVRCLAVTLDGSPLEGSVAGTAR